MIALKLLRNLIEFCKLNFKENLIKFLRYLVALRYNGMHRVFKLALQGIDLRLYKKIKEKCLGLVYNQRKWHYGTRYQRTGQRQVLV